MQKYWVQRSLIFVGFLVTIMILGLSGINSVYSGLDELADISLTPQVHLPLIVHNYPLPTPTPFATPILIQRYQIEYSVQVDEPHVWMPAPRYWDGNGVRQISITEISPQYTDRYREENGTEIIYWQNPSAVSQVFKIVFDVEIGFVEYGIDENQEWPPYDVNSDLYSKNIMATTWVQVDHPEIQAQAAAIVGNETNPYIKARLIHQWVAENIGPPPGLNDPRDALSTLRNGYSDCGGHANLFVALSRASGVPARNISGIHNPYGDYLQNGSWNEETLHTHVWSEFYLPEYGWIQVDPTRSDMFARIHEPRLVTAKGNDIQLGYGNPCGELSWFHMPYAPCQNPGESLWLTVTQLP